MPLVVNGTTIPTNVANALMVNGVSITKVVANGVAVWNQSLFSAHWSGSTILFETSGSGYRFVWGSVIGAWVYANTTTGLSDGSSLGFTNNGYGFVSTSSTLKLMNVATGNATTFVYYSKVGGFTGRSYCGTGFNFFEFNTSGGLMTGRNSSSGAYGPYISLT